MNKGTKTLILYACIIAFFGLLMYGIATRGAALQSAAGTGVPAAQSGGGGVDALWHHLLEEVRSSIGLLLLQIIVILLSCRFFAWLFRLMHQPTVVGEILAGIVLGPSVLGKLAPGVSAFIFPPESLENIYILSMFGLVLFMFAIGMELDFAEVRKRWKGTLLISHASTIVPFFVGMLIAYFIYEKYAGETTPFLPFALFIGISMSITAFPVLARIIRERKMTRSHLGTLALSSAAAGDITAWFLLAFVIAISQAGSMASAAYSLLLSCLYLLFMFFPVRRYLRKVGERYENEEVINKVMVAQLFLVLIFSAYLTQILGLHALFGAFVAGVVMPENLKFRNIMTEKVEDVSLSLFLPLFFVSTGLR
ncbi:MAG: cation:proton antiporter, partial [Tannerella sp.]|nr:cation:proton antiporter [Tannerella sp.]